MVEGKGEKPTRACIKARGFGASKVTQLWNERDEKASRELLNLAQCPIKRVTYFDGYVVNGYTFQTKAQVKNLNTHNCGVLVKGAVHSGEKECFGPLKEIIELDYGSIHKVILFDCEWYDVFSENVGIKRETYGITTVNVKTNEPYVLASQVEQVYYVKDHLHQNWQVVLKTNPHNFYGIPSDDEDEGAKLFPVSDDEANKEAYIPMSAHGAMSLVRNDVELDVVDVDLVAQQL